MFETEIFTISETKTTPEIRFDFSWGILEIKGVSIPEYPAEYYRPLMDAISRYAKKTKETTTVNFSLKYFNSSSARSLLNIISAFKSIVHSSSKIIVNWYYDMADEDQLETVKDLEDLSGIKFNYIGV